MWMKVIAELKKKQLQESWSVEAERSRFNGKAAYYAKAQELPEDSGEWINS